MKINQDYKMAYRHGYFVDKHQFRAEHESAWIVAWCIGLALLICLAASCQHVMQGAA